MNTDKNDSVRTLDLGEIERVAGAKAREPADTGLSPDAVASQLSQDTAVTATEPISPFRRFMSMRI